MILEVLPLPSWLTAIKFHGNYKLCLVAAAFSLHSEIVINHLNQPQESLEKHQLTTDVLLYICKV